MTLGAIAMHGLRQVNQQLGATVLVVGLGLVGHWDETLELGY